ncbi:MAG: CRTAC1 family protein [Planctomycetes bacterium]|nr:CRTAC1 family protein [Planctomycetota bacterium]
MVGRASFALAIGMAGALAHARADEPAALEEGRKPALLRTLAERIVRSNAPFFGEVPLEKCARQVAAFGPREDPRVEIPARLQHGELLLQFGRYDEAIAQLAVALDLALARREQRNAQQAAKLLGLAWLRVGERANCIAQHGPDSCLFPLQGGAIHVDAAGSERALACFAQALELDPNDQAAMWLLNLAAMALGRFPAAVPEAWRIPPESLASEQLLPRWRDRAGEFGLEGNNLAGGSILDDFDGDGRQDVVLSSMHPSAPLRLWLQRTPGEFTEVGEQAGLHGQLGGLNVIHFDADDDGRLDLLVLRGGWMGQAGELPNSLLLQQRDGTFVDRTLEAGLEIAAPTQAACVADIDLDGDLDLFVGYEGDGDRYPSKLWRNRGDATFEEIAAPAGIVRCGFVKGCAFGDIDRDGLPDLYVSTMRGANRLYRNLDGSRFEEVAAARGVAEPRDGFSCFFLDYDQDGALDLFASAYPECDRTAAMGAWHVLGKRRCETQRLYRNDGEGRFTDVSAAVGLDRVAFPMGSNFGDLDNDGYPDLYLATGAPDYSALFPNLLLRNDGGRRFLDVSAATGTGHLQKGHGVSFCDLDGDGDQELFVELGGALPDDAFRNACYENPGAGNRWLTVRLQGVRSNHFGVGARVRVRVATATGERTIHADGGGNSSFGGNSHQLELGLGAATRILALEVHWPASRTTQRFAAVPLDAVVKVVEGAAAPELVVVEGEGR